MKKQFFGEQGLTSTSANHVANMAKEFVETQKAKLNAICFYNQKTSAAGHTYNTKIATSLDDVNNIKLYISQISKATQLISWLREALKEKSSFEPLSYTEWCKENGIVPPQPPKEEPVITREQVIATWDVEKYNSYFSHQTNAAVLGEYIHPSGSISNARKVLNHIVNNPTSVEGSGRDLMVSEFTPAYSTEFVDSLFFDLQKKQREEQALFNKLEHEITSAIEQDDIEKTSRYKIEYGKYSETTSLIFNEYKLYEKVALQRNKDLKIIIPESLKEIYTIIQDLGK